jgi:hypothetical protein
MLPSVVGLPVDGFIPNILSPDSFIPGIVPSD